MNNVKHYRKKLGLTQKDMGEVFGISVQSYSAKELGKTDYNSREMMVVKQMVQKIKPDVTIDEIFFNGTPEPTAEDVLYEALEAVIKANIKIKGGL